jgi:hypothetical protein
LCESSFSGDVGKPAINTYTKLPGLGRTRRLLGKCSGRDKERHHHNGKQQRKNTPACDGFNASSHFDFLSLGLSAFMAHRFKGARLPLLHFDHDLVDPVCKARFAFDNNGLNHRRSHIDANERCRPNKLQSPAMGHWSFTRSPGWRTWPS